MMDVTEETADLLELLRILGRLKQGRNILLLPQSTGGEVTCEGGGKLDPVYFSNLSIVLGGTFSFSSLDLKAFTQTT